MISFEYAMTEQSLFHCQSYHHEQRNPSSWINTSFPIPATPAFRWYSGWPELPLLQAWEVHFQCTHSNEQDYEQYNVITNHEGFVRLTFRPHSKDPNSESYPSSCCVLLTELSWSSRIINSLSKLLREVRSRWSFSWICELVSKTCRMASFRTRFCW